MIKMILFEYKDVQASFKHKKREIKHTIVSPINNICLQVLSKFEE